MKTIRTKLIFCLSIILLSGFFLTNYFSYTASRKQVRASIIENSLPLSRDNIYSEIQRDLTRPVFVSSLMANDTFLKDWVIKGEQDSRLIQKYLMEIRDKYDFFSSFFISDITLNYYHFKGILKRISPEDDHDTWYYDFKKKNKDYDLDVDTNEADQNHLTIFINHRLTGYDGSFLGVVGVGLDFKRVASLLSEYKGKYRKKVYMVAPDGLIMVHTDPSKIETRSVYQEEGLSTVASRLLTQVDHPGLFEYDKGGHHILVTSLYIEELGWFLMVEQDETLAMTSIKTALYRNLIFSAAVTLATLVVVFWIINFFQKRLETMAVTDPLTRAYNRNEFESRFKYKTEMNRRTPGNMCLVLFDSDHFKSVNDTLGHLAGDRIIQSVARIAGQTIRDQDMLVRWGGDEFILLLQTSLDTASQVAERLRLAVAGHDFFDPADAGTSLPQVTVTCGIAQYKEKDSLDDLILRADKALYRGKEKGRNRVVAEKISD